MNAEWTREDYIEEDVRRHSEELRQVTQVTSQNAAALNALIKENERARETFYRFVEQVEKEFERRQTLIDNVELRLRDLEQWKSRTGTYWAMGGFVIATVVAGLINVTINMIG